MDILLRKLDECNITPAGVLSEDYLNGSSLPQHIEIFRYSGNFYAVFSSIINVLFFYAIVKLIYERQISWKFYVLVANLSLIYILTGIWMIAFSIATDPPVLLWLNNASYSLIWAFMTNDVAICVVQIVAIKKPLYFSTKLTKKIFVFIIAIVWVSSFALIGLIPLEEWEGFREELDEDFAKEKNHVATDIVHIFFDILIFFAAAGQVFAYILVYFKSAKQIRSIPFGSQSTLRNRVKFVNTLMTIMLVQLIFAVPMLILAYVHYENIGIWNILSKVGPPIWEATALMLPPTCRDLLQYKREINIYHQFATISWIAKAIQYARCMVDPTVHTVRKPEIWKIIKQILLRPFCCFYREKPISRRNKKSIMTINKLYGEKAVFVIRF